MTASYVRAILWAQARVVRNQLPRKSTLGLVFSILIATLWYGAFTVLAVAAAFLAANPHELGTLERALPGGLLFAFFYWQVVPLLLVSTGSALDVKKLLVYPIPRSQLFGLEVLLRLSTGLEVVLVVAGTSVGLLLNPRIPLWAPLPLLAFIVFNLFLSAGIRDLLTRLFARKIIREVLIFVFVLAAALPQFLVNSGGLQRLTGLPHTNIPEFLPWSLTAQLALGRFSVAAALALALWTVAAYVFGRWQFNIGLRFDAEAVAAPVYTAAKTPGRWEAFFQFPARLFPDPLAAIMEKDLRVLLRSARFRLTFLMGFSFGLLIWLPVTFGPSGSSGSWLSRNYLAVISIYSLLLLSDGLLLNCFGFDRSATQLYFVVPVRIASVFIAKNLTAWFFISLEVALIALVCALLRFPFTLAKLFEAYLITLTVAFFITAIGNLTSAYYPKPINPGKSFRNSAERQTVTVLMFFFPISMIPAALAYAARYAWGTNLAFFAVLLVFLIFDYVLYRVALPSAVATTQRRKEEMIAALSRGAGPIAS